MVRDQIFSRFLQKQADDAQALTAASDIVRISPLYSGPGPAQHFLCRFACTGFVKNDDGQIARHNCWDLGVYFADEYLRSANPGEVVTLLAPRSVYHPNIRGGPGGHVCLGESFLRPGTPLAEIAFQVFDILTFKKWSGHGLNEEASRWAMSNPGLLPADPRSLKRRFLHLDIQRAAAAGGGRT